MHLTHLYRENIVVKNVFYVFFKFFYKNMFLNVFLFYVCFLIKNIYNTDVAKEP